jgi:hypothetical protein
MHLPLEAKSLAFQFMAKTSFIDRFKKTWPQSLMDFDSSTNDSVRKIVLLHEASLDYVVYSRFSLNSKVREEKFDFYSGVSLFVFCAFSIKRVYYRPLPLDAQGTEAAKLTLKSKDQKYQL